jgi:hypothetical protein
MAVDLIQISGRTKTAEGESLSKTPYVIIGEGVDIQGQTSDAGTFTETLEGTVDVKSLEITFLPNGDFFQKSITNLVPTSTTFDPNEDKIIDIYNIGNITLAPLVPNFDNFQKDLQIKVQEVENLEIEVENFRKLDKETKFAIILNRAKEAIKRTLFPFILGLLAEFGLVYLQAVLDRVPGVKAETCPDPEKIKEIIRKRNQLVKQINRFYQMITRAEGILRIAGGIIAGLEFGIQTAKLTPLTYSPAAVPSALAKVERRLEIAGIAVGILQMAAATIGFILAQILELLRALDLALQNCSEEQNIPMEEINSELNALASRTIKATELDENDYKGFTFEIKEDPTNVSKYTKRFAQALNRQKVPVLKSESSFASNPQVLIDQLKFIIDSQDLKAD